MARAERFPDPAGIREKIVTAREILPGGPMAEQAAPALRQPARAGPDDASLAATPAGFEGLGGGPDHSTGHGCGFGFVRRHDRIETLSLLRWSGVSLPDLTRAPEAGFAGLGSPGSTVLRTRPGASDRATVDTTCTICCPAS